MMEWISALLEAAGGWIRKNPREAITLVVTISLLSATIVQSGWVGVLFRWGRARRVVEPGFRWLIPGVEKVKKLHSRAITMELPRQRVATEEGLVYDVTASIAYRVGDPVAALIEIDDVASGVRTAVALAVSQVLRPQSRASVKDRDLLGDLLTGALREKVARWGIEVDRAGFTTIAPTGPTLRLTQLPALVRERAAAAAALGLALDQSLHLLGADRRPVSHAHARYRGRSRKPLLTLNERSKVGQEIDRMLADDREDLEAPQLDISLTPETALGILRRRLGRARGEDERARIEGLMTELKKRKTRRLARPWWERLLENGRSGGGGRI